MELLLKKLLEIPEANSLATAVEGNGCPAAVTGLASVHKAQMAAALTLRTGDTHSLDQLAQQLTAAGYARSSLVEVGAQTNTFEEAKNAMEPLAEVLDMVLQGK